MVLKVLDQYLVCLESHKWLLESLISMFGSFQKCSNLEQKKSYKMTMQAIKLLIKRLSSDSFRDTC